jgi:hypothetical protein
MCHRVFIFISFLYLFGCNNSKKEINDTCILIEVQKQTVSCGVLSVWVGMKFKKVSDSKEFIGLIHCPEMYDSSFFQVGKKYFIKGTHEAKDMKGELIINVYSKQEFLIYKINEIQ